MRLLTRAVMGALLLVGLTVLVVAAASDSTAPKEDGTPTTISLPVVMSPTINYDYRLANPSFEDGWTDIMPPPGCPYGCLINQQPNGWTLSWIDPGSMLYDSNDPATGVGELIHKLASQLPEHERPGQPAALILEGVHVYKMFHRAGAFGAQLTQRIESMPPGVYRLTVPVQLHWQEKLDPEGDWDQYTAESGAWVLTDGMQSGGWAHAKQVGDRKWFYHVVEFNVQEGAAIDVLIRVKSKYRSPKDFFVDDIRLEKVQLPGGALPDENSILWRPQRVSDLAAAERVTLNWTR